MIKANDPSVRTIRTVCGALDYFQAIQPENRFSAESIFKKKYTGSNIVLDKKGLTGNTGNIVANKRTKKRKDPIEPKD
jgi:hypothetical protein